jgi:dephospho-CoA kinase
LSKWPDKYIIGLTGNIATGKSVVRRMLEHLGAYGIDADALAHRAIAKNAPGYQPVINVFGRWILNQDGEIDRARLGKVVFADAEAMRELESIIHPLVISAVDIIISRSRQKVVVIEAIKLLETNLRQVCDSIWVTNVPRETQVQRLVKNRKLSVTEARMRVDAQPPAHLKLGAANIVIDNTGTFEETWFRVVSEWQKLFPQAEKEPEPLVVERKEKKISSQILRGKPSHSANIADLYNRLRPADQKISRADVMAAFGEKAFLLLNTDSRFSGLIAWQVENLVSRTVDILIDPLIDADLYLPALMEEMEKASSDLQSEASLVFVPKRLAGLEQMWKKMGYLPLKPAELTVSAWQEAAVESAQADTVLYFKQLRQDRVLRPI